MQARSPSRLSVLGPNSKATAAETGAPMGVNRDLTGLPGTLEVSRTPRRRNTTSNLEGAQGTHTDVCPATTTKPTRSTGGGGLRSLPPDDFPAQARP